MTIIGYARVSTDGQDLTGQLDQLRAAGCTKVYDEKISGERRRNRPKLIKLLQDLKPGDCVYVTRLDRLARNTQDLLFILDVIDEQKASFKSLGDPWCDTQTPHGKLMVTVLSGLAEFERSLIKARTSEGRKQAKERGVKMGRKPLLNAYQRGQALDRHEKEGHSYSDIARTYGVSYMTIARVCQQGRPGAGGSPAG